MAILRIDASLRWPGVDEDSSEDVALACIEWLLAETNAQYRQHCLAADAIASVATKLSDNVADAVRTATLASELPVESERFSAEPQPAPELRDRHAARSVLFKSPEKTTGSSSPVRAAAAAVMATMTSSTASSAQSPVRRIPKAMVEQTSARVRRRKRVEKDAAPIRDVRTPVLPHVIDRTEEFMIVEEAPGNRQWRLACLKELEESRKKPGFTKWATVARAFTLPGSEPSSVDPEITTGLAPGQASPGRGVLKLRTNLDSFSSIHDIQRSPPDWQRESGFSDIESLAEALETATIMSATTKGLNPVSESKAKRRAGVPSKSQRGSVVLNDILSRHSRPVVSQVPSSSSLYSSGNTAVHGGGGLWKYDRQVSSTPILTSLQSSASVTPITDLTLDLATLANSPSGLASGVVLARGDTVIEGPERVDSPSNMSKKRFDLHQRLTMDYLLNGSELDTSGEMLHSSPGSPPSLTPTHGSDRQLAKNYIEEPAVPIQLPLSLEPLAPDALAIPRTHLSTTLSVPSLRVRTPTSVQSGATRTGFASESSRSKIDTSADLKRQRPSTAISGTVLSTALAGRGKGSLSTTALVSGRSTYMREFPKPPKGVVIRAVSTVTASPDEALRVAWSS